MRVRLRTKLVGSMLTLSLLILVVTTTLITQYSMDRLKGDAESYRFMVLGAFTMLSNSVLDTVRDGMSFLGRLLPRDDLSEVERERRVLDWMKSSDYIHKIAMFHPDGRRLFVAHWKEKQHKLTPPSRLSPAMMKRAMVQNTLYLPIEFGSDRKPYLPIVMPFLVDAEKKIVAYIWTAIDQTILFKRMKNLVRRGQENLPIESLFLVDRKLRMFLHSHRKLSGFKLLGWFPKEMQNISKEGVKSQIVYKGEVDHQGKGFLYSAQFPPGSSYGMVVQQSVEGLDAFVGGVRIRALQVGGGFALVALLVGLLLGSRLAKPVVQVAEASEKVADGQFDVRVSVHTRDEVGDMARSFNVMAASLEGYRDQLIEETRIRTELGRYLSAELVEGVVDKKMEVKLGGERRKVTVLFADIVAFTKVVENRDPEQIVAILNELFTFFTEIIFKHGGIIDKFIGDCVMAVFGAPYGDKDDAINAVYAADEMKRWLEVGNARWEKELGMPIEVGMGIHTGEALAGNIGSQKRMEYTVIGDTVNVAARLETLARPGQILMTAETVAEVEDEFECVSLGMHALQGREHTIELFMLAEE